MIALNKCRWVFEISESILSGKEKSFQWSAKTSTMDKDCNYQYANGGVGRLHCVRLFNTPKDIKKHINKFIKLNKIGRHGITRKKND